MQWGLCHCTGEASGVARVGAAGADGTLVDVLDEVLARLLEQRLAWQAGRGVAGGDDDGTLHRGPPCPAGVRRWDHPKRRLERFPTPRARPYRPGARQTAA